MPLWTPCPATALGSSRLLGVALTPTPHPIHWSVLKVFLKTSVLLSLMFQRTTGSSLVSDFLQLVEGGLTLQPRVLRYVFS